TRRERRRGRGEHVAALERRGGVGSRGELVHRLHTNLVDHDGEEPVVRADVETPAGLDDEAPARAPHAWIDNRKVNGSAAEVTRAREQHEGARRDIEPGHLMRYVDEHRVGTPGKHDALHRGDQRGARPEVGREGHDRRRDQSTTSTLFLSRGLLRRDSRAAPRNLAGCVPCTLPRATTSPTPRSISWARTCGALSSDPWSGPGRSPGSTGACLH